MYTRTVGRNLDPEWEDLPVNAGMCNIFRVNTRIILIYYLFIS